MPQARPAPAIEHHSNTVEQPGLLAPRDLRRDAFAPLVASPLAEFLRDQHRTGQALDSVPSAGAPEPVTLFADGQRRINLGTNNYLGLAGDPRVIEAASAALRQFGTSTSGSRILNGTTRLHLQLEEELADFYGVEAAVLTSSGINANVAVLSTAGAPGDVVLVDGHAHASVHAGAAASAATAVRFRHNSVESLTQRLDQADPEAGALIVVDGVYSMSGETAPLPEIVDLCDRFAARLVVDEAHGLGVLGEHGRGAAEKAGVLDRVDAVTIAFSKSLASVGGAVLTSQAVAEGIRSSALPYLFSAANDPGAVGAALASLRILRSEPERRERVAANAALLRRLLTEAGAEPVPGRGAVIAVSPGNEEATTTAWRAAYAAGVYTNAVCYPAVPRGHGVLRISVMATHTEEQLSRAAEVIGAAVATARADAEAVG